MNLHIKDIDLFEHLKKATLFKTIIGSKMYGNDNQDSDTDYLYIYVPSIDERNTFKKSHHQLQYKDYNNKEDHIFVDIFTFIHNTIYGDSTISFEVINNDLIKDSPLNFLYEMRMAFHNYNILKSYNGLALRDAKHIIKNKQFYTKEHFQKRLSHVIRGHEFAEMILDNQFNTIFNKDLNEYDLYQDDKLTDYIENKLRPFRLKINELKDNKEIPKFMKVEEQKLLDIELTKLINSDQYINKSNWNMDLTIFYKANETPEIKYE
jgi:predicted nucleotidyltransferase